MADRNRKHWLGRCAMLLIAALALLPAGCGKKGDPELPNGETDEFPRQYPDPDSL
jgi:predicted small lipoprotein YifL